MAAKIFSVTENNYSSAVNASAEALKNGGLLVFPTETVYGIGVNALDTDALLRLYSKKQRPLDKPLLMHISGIDMAEEIAELDDRSRELIRRFSPGPLTLVVKRKPLLPGIAVSGGDTVGLRFPSNQLFLDIAKAFGGPIAATSANISGCKSAVSDEDLSPVIDIADVILKDGSCELGLESTIVSMVGESPKILRQGSFPRQLLEEVLGKCE